MASLPRLLGRPSHKIATSICCSVAHQRPVHPPAAAAPAPSSVAAIRHFTWDAEEKDLITAENTGPASRRLRCKRCNLPGHSRWECKTPKCTLCHTWGHADANCPRRKSVCPDCGEPGHGRRGCPTKVPCRHCKQLGHRAANCHFMNARRPKPADVDALIAEITQKPRPPMPPEVVEARRKAAEAKLEENRERARRRADALVQRHRAAQVKAATRGATYKQKYEELDKVMDYFSGRTRRILERPDRIKKELDGDDDDDGAKGRWPGEKEEEMEQQASWAELENLWGKLGKVRGATTKEVGEDKEKAAPAPPAFKIRRFAVNDSAEKVAEKKSGLRIFVGNREVTTTTTTTTTTTALRPGMQQQRPLRPLPMARGTDAQGKQPDKTSF